jgi:glycosyltransferase involved in cell wall biosynthesis
MRIAVNCRFLLPGRLEGLGRYTWEVLTRMMAVHPDAQWHLIFDRPAAARYYEKLFRSTLPKHFGSDADALERASRASAAIMSPIAHGSLLTAFPQARHPLLYVWYFEHSLPRLLADLRPDVFFSPDGYLCLNLTENIPQVGVIHDLAFEHFPQDVDPLHRWHYRTFFPQYARRAAVLLTVSESTRHDLHTRYCVPLERIRVTYCGASGAIRPLPTLAQLLVRDRFSSGQPYFLHVGAIQPRKNLDVLLRAFDAFKTETGSPAMLLIVGRHGWRYGAVQQAFNHMVHNADVAFTGWVTDAELAQLYAAAVALVYPSRFEGFGLPVLETFHAEVPVITTNVSSLPEVAGDAALLVPPSDVPALTAALVRIATDGPLRQQLIANGRTQRERFSWNATANTVWAALIDATRAEAR